MQLYSSFAHVNLIHNYMLHLCVSNAKQFEVNRSITLGLARLSRRCLRAQWFIKLRVEDHTWGLHRSAGQMMSCTRDHPWYGRRVGLGHWTEGTPYSQHQGVQEVWRVRKRNKRRLTGDEPGGDLIAGMWGGGVVEVD
jgi:hypothetical protein